MFIFSPPPFTENLILNSERIPAPRPCSNATRNGRAYRKVLLIRRVAPLDLHRDRKRDVRPRLRLAHEKAQQRPRHLNNLHRRNALPKSQFSPTASRHQQYHNQYPTYRGSLTGAQANRGHYDHAERSCKLRWIRRSVRARKPKCSAMAVRR